ncbi:hypothetical protein F8M41_021886 [Gigaspora margarita]|uniref:Uncharacterized protein n=1 Tax=Gigaspora margarita TaxID=4874 RepID=A0A8H4AFZ0_GIGMA|nr:hypothetical protein F8M41_021886 [Gigaspora margarita]
MEDIKRTKISIRFPEEVVGKTWAERFSFICRKILSGIRNQVVLLQFYYYLGKCLEEMAWSSAARDNIAQEIPGDKGKVVLRIATRAYWLYNIRGFYNILDNKHITANALYRMTKKNFLLLVEEARRVRAKEFSNFFETIYPSQEHNII